MENEAEEEEEDEKERRIWSTSTMYIGSVMPPVQYLTALLILPFPPMKSCSWLSRTLLLLLPSIFAFFSPFSSWSL